SYFTHLHLPASEAVLFPPSLECLRHLRRDRSTQRWITVAAVLLLRLKLPINRGVDQHAGPLAVPVFDRIPLLRRHTGIEHRPRGSRERRYIAEPGVHPVAERPLDGFPIVDIDVGVDDDGM